MALSFYVKSSVTGTYGVGLANNAETENFVAEYTINSANTWEKKTINIPVRTSGTWLTDNSVGIGVRWDLGSGYKLIMEQQGSGRLLHQKYIEHQVV